MFNFLIDEKRRIIIGHPSLGKLFFSGTIDKNNFIENIQAFASDLCNKKLNPRIRFTAQELKRVIKEIVVYPNQYWSGQIPIVEDETHAEIHKAKEFFVRNFRLVIGKDGFVARELTDQQLEALHNWVQANLSSTGGIMPTIEDFYRETYLAASLWRQEEGGTINYLFGKGAGVEIALQGKVLGRTRRQVKFSYRSHSDFELYGVVIMQNPYTREFKAVFGAQEIYPLTNTKGLINIPQNLLLNTAEVVDFGGIRIRIPELELLFLDKFVSRESTPRPEGYDAELLAQQYVLDKKKTQKYLTKFVINPALININEEARKALANQIEAIKRNFGWIKSGQYTELIEPTHEIIVMDLNRQMTNASSGSSISGMRADYWIQMRPSQIDDGGNITNQNLLRQIKKKIEQRKQNRVRLLKELRAKIDALL